MLVAAIPFAAAVALTLAYGVDVPIADEWSFLPGVVRAFDGATTFEDVWLPAAEHVAVFPRLVMLGLARLTSWNLRIQMLVTLAFALGALLFLGRGLSRAGAPAWSVALAACFVFSFHSHETFLWAYQLHIAMAAFGTVGALTLLGAETLRPRTVAAAIVLACVASGSFLNGFLVWPAGALVLAVRRHEGRGARWRLLALWFGVGLVLVLVALVWIRPRRPDLSASAAVVLEFAARWIGTGLLGPAADGGASRIAGWIGLAIVLATAVIAIRGRAYPAVLALVAIGLFGIASAGMTAVGRAVLGGLQAAQSSRYTTFSGLIWIAVAVLPGLVAIRGRRIPRLAHALISGAVALVLIVTEVNDLRTVRELSERRRLAAAALRQGEGISWSAVETLFAAPDELVPVLAERVGMMRRLRLSLFREAAAAELEPPRWIGTLEARMSVETRDGGRVGGFEITGGVPGNLAFLLIVAGTAVRPLGPLTLDAAGRAIGTFDAESVPAGALSHVLSLDRQARIVNTDPAPVPR